MTDRSDSHVPAPASSEAVELEIERLRRAERRKDEFLGQLAHEIGNILVPLPLALEILKQPALSPATLARVREILEDQAGYIQRLVSQLRSISRLTRGIDVHRKDIEFQPLVERAVAAVRPQADARRHELHVSLPPEAVWLSADGERLEQALTYLLDNAVEYTEPGGRITLTAERTAGELAIRVEDTGCGVDAELLPHIFEPFVRREKTLDWLSGRLGIGLPLARQCIELHGGSIMAESRGAGQGSTFTVRLPTNAGGETEAG